MAGRRNAATKPTKTLEQRLTALREQGVAV